MRYILDKGSYYYSKDSFGFEHSFWALQKQSWLTVKKFRPYSCCLIRWQIQKPVRQIFSGLINGGIVDHLVYNSLMEEADGTRTGSGMSASPKLKRESVLNMKQFFGAFLVCFVGWGLAIIIFAMEKINIVM